MGEEALKLYRLLNSFKYAFEGLIHALKTQLNMKIHFLITFLVLILCIFFQISRIELLMVFFSIFLVIMMELVNTAIEIIIDMISKEYRISARIAKNVSAGAVLIAAINALIVGFLIFGDKLKYFLNL